MTEAASVHAVTTDQVADIGRCQSLLPREADFIGRKGYSRRFREDGSYSWRYRFQQNDRGKRTAAGHEVLERMTPFMRADTERHAKIEAKKPRAVLRDKSGRRRLIDPALADRAARENGWSHVSSGGASRVEGGVGGMLWKWLVREWWPLGVRCLGTPLKGSRRVSRKVIQYDPDGHPWRWIAGAWRRTV